MINKTAALLIIYETSRNVQKAVDRIIGWDECKTIEENCSNLKVRIMTGALFARRYGLKSKKSSPIGQLTADKEKIKKLISIGYGFSQIARIYSISRQRIEQFVKNNKLLKS